MLNRKYIFIISLIALLLGFTFKHLAVAINEQTSAIRRLNVKLKKNNQTLISKIKLLKNYQKELPDIITTIKQLHTVPSKEAINALYNKITDYCAYKDWKYTKLKNKNNLYSFDINVNFTTTDVAHSIAELAALYHLASDVYFNLNSLALSTRQPEAKLTGYILYAKGKGQSVKEKARPEVKTITKVIPAPVAKTSQSNSTNATQNAIGTKQSNTTQNATRTRQDNSTQNSINEDAEKVYQQLQKTQEKLQKIKKVMDALKG